MRNLRLLLFMFLCLPMGYLFGQSGAPVMVRVNPQNGNYSVHSNMLNWTFKGTIGEALKDVKQSKGKDAVGDYQQYRFNWNGGQYEGTIKWYMEKPVVLFAITLPKGLSQQLPAFPAFTTIPNDLFHFSYHNDVFSAPEFKLNQTSTPWLLFDSSNNACVISPASDFIVSKMTGDGSTSISSGLNQEVTHLPAGFTHSTILTLDNSIHGAWDQWGTTLRSLYNRHRPANDATPLLKYYGYWTDNGADYYYNYDTTKGYIQTLLALRQHYRKLGIPLGYMQLDSWWYEKSIDDPDGKPVADHKNPNLPKGPWNRYGGLMDYTADPYLFPHGLKAFQKELGLPMATHNRWIDPKSAYHEKYKISGYAATDPAFWKDIMRYLKSSGVVCYEQDWLNYIYDKSPEMISDINIGNEFTDGMAEGAKKYGLNLQYCMAMPRFFLQGLKYNNLTTIRTSDDRFNREKWMHFIFTSQLAYEIGAWPWCDVFKSNEMGNMILSVLSAGAVGTGDAIGKENKQNIMLACRTDGVLVKPDVPILPLDKDYVNIARKDEQPMEAFTYTRHDSIRTSYLFAFCDKKTENRTCSFRPVELGMKGRVVVFNPENNKVQQLDAADRFMDQLPDNDYAYYIVAPITSCGIAFLGDKNKIAATGAKRIADIVASAKQLKIKILFAKGESGVRLQGYSVGAIQTEDGVLNSDPVTHLFTLDVIAPKSGNSVVVNITRGEK